MDTSKIYEEKNVRIKRHLKARSIALVIILFLSPGIEFMIVGPWELMNGYIGCVRIEEPSYELIEKTRAGFELPADMTITCMETYKTGYGSSDHGVRFYAEDGRTVSFGHEHSSEQFWYDTICSQGVRVPKPLKVRVIFYSVLGFLCFPFSLIMFVKNKNDNRKKAKEYTAS